VPSCLVLPRAPKTQEAGNRTFGHAETRGGMAGDEGGALPITAFDALSILAAVYLVARLVGYIGTRLFGGDRPKAKVS
jgi:hypothetical protein